MAKVIRINKSKAKTLTHSECGAVIEYFENEVVKIIENEPYGGGTDMYRYLRCPNCNKMIRWC